MRVNDSMHLEAIYDPYDLWASSKGVLIRRKYYAGRVSGKLGAVGFGLLDWLMPYMARKVCEVEALAYPIVLGQEILRRRLSQPLSEQEAEIALQKILSVAVAVNVEGATGLAWGLGFSWMCKNGLYGPEIPFVTHTPYVMEALLVLAEHPLASCKAMKLFHGTWDFLGNLKIMHEGDGELTLSYAPIDEPRMVVNANSYAAFAYALHAVHGKEELRETARIKCEKLVRWIVQQQGADGSWFYYADKDAGNFIDCFHSCFVVKNLLKVSKLLPDLSALIQPSADSGWFYIKNMFYDGSHGLCRRFTVRAQRDPFRWDLYDQAEYLGLLVDFGLLAEASAFAERVEKKFCKNDHWYCRIDIFGRRWGKDFLRWGIVPFWYQLARLNNAQRVN